MIKGLIFDLDGTILDSMPSWYKLGLVYAEKKGVSDYEFFSNLLKVYSIKESSKILKEKYFKNEDENDILNDLQRLLKELYFKEVKLKKNVLQFLEKSFNKGILMYLATATDKNLVIDVLKHFKLDKYFMGIITVNETRSKRYPDIYDYACKMLKLNKDEVLVFEDALYAIKTLNLNGYNVIGIADSFEKREEIEPRVLKYIDDFKNIENIL